MIVHLGQATHHSEAGTQQRRDDFAGERGGDARGDIAGIGNHVLLKGPRDVLAGVELAWTVVGVPAAADRARVLRLVAAGAVEPLNTDALAQQRQAIVVAGLDDRAYALVADDGVVDAPGEKGTNLGSTVGG